MAIIYDPRALRGLCVARETADINLGPMHRGGRSAASAAGALRGQVCSGSAAGVAATAHPVCKGAAHARRRCSRAAARAEAEGERGAAGGAGEEEGDAGGGRGDEGPRGAAGGALCSGGGGAGAAAAGEGCAAGATALVLGRSTRLGRALPAGKKATKEAERGVAAVQGWWRSRRRAAR